MKVFRFCFEVMFGILLAWVIWQIIQYAISGRILSTFLSLYGFGFLALIFEFVRFMFDIQEGVIDVMGVQK